MPTIPLTNKIHTVTAGVETENKGSAQANAGREAYTIQDLADTIDPGTMAGQEGFIPLYTSANSIGKSLLTQATLGTEKTLFFGGGAATPLVASILNESVLRIESQDAAPSNALTAGTIGNMVLYLNGTDANNGIYVCVQSGVAGSAVWAKSALITLLA